MIAALHAQTYNVTTQILGVLQSSILIVLIRIGADAIQAVMLQVLAYYIFLNLISIKIDTNCVFTNQNIVFIPFIT